MRPLRLAPLRIGGARAASVVHYVPYPGIEPGLEQLPWVAAAPTTTGIVGHLFYYDNQIVWHQEQLPRAADAQGGLYGRGQAPSAWRGHRRRPSSGNPEATCRRSGLPGVSISAYLARRIGRSNTNR